jgi:hypothetical protein
MRRNLWYKVRPLKIDKQFIVPKTFCDLYDEERNSLLPYSVLQASPAIDIWSFGVLLFRLVSGSDFLFVNRDDDIENDAKDHPAIVTDDKIHRKILSSIPSTLGANASLVRALLTKCLKVNPKERIFSMAEILEDPFFTGSTDAEKLLSQQSEMMKKLQRIDETTQRIEENTIQIKDISVGLRTQLKTTETVLLRGIFEATEVKIPTCFIILNQKLVPNHLSETGMELLNNMEKPAERWLHKLGQLGIAVDSAVAKISNGPSKLINNAIEQLWKGEKLWLYLVDERTMKPVIPEDDSIYPIQITIPKEWIPKLSPLLKISLKVLRTLNTVSGFARCLGYPVPVLSSEIFSSIESAVGQITKKSSVEEYELLHEVVMNTGTTQSSNNKSVRGESLREFERFLSSHDSECKFAGLKRLCTVEGFACWTTEEGKQEIAKEADEEEKSDFRKAENPNSNEIKEDEEGKVEKTVFNENKNDEKRSADYIVDISLRMSSRLKKTKIVLLRGMFEATEVKISTCFIILNQKLVPNHLNTNDTVSSTRVESSKHWLSKLSQLGFSIDSVVKKTAYGSSEIRKALESLWKGEELWLYFIDEKTMTPVIPEDDSIYPIPIASPKEWIYKLVPLLKISLKATTIKVSLKNKI